ncbi:MAG: hypothetical protein U9Q81_02615 [Pseudomonadota bacterium]|nr:hypothetical protein [Pseudomonadota bacterium]
MDRKIILYVLAAALLAFIAIMLFPGREGDPRPKLPWDIAVDDQGRASVFTLTLGESTFADARRLFGEEGEINLFAHPGRDPVVEVYFERIYLSGLRADFVMTLDVPADTAERMYEHGLRISQLPSGSKKVKMAPEDIDVVTQVPIRSITYLPAARLEAALIESRFGEPADKLTEESGIGHWLYPEKGLDVGRDPDGNVVIQYVNPGVFQDLLKPLRHEQAETQKSDR